ncbi:MAG: hypothetical protein V2I63_03095 [Pseudomonadales bacterium]|jgi:hypothetical protein|nr:hypothetical protein [Pseudomonadales bacterium]
MTPATRRALTSTLLAGAFLGLAATGLLAYFTPWDADIAGIHTVLGLAVLVAFGFHLRNNFRALVGYLRSKGRILLGAGVPLLLVLAVLMELPPASTLLETGQALRGTARVTEGRFQVIRTRAATLDAPLRISVRAGTAYESAPQPLFLGLSYTSIPQMAFWLEDTDGRFLETLYVTAKLASSGFQSTDPFSEEVIRRPEALPVWAHRRGVRYGDGLMVPLPESDDLDGVTAATPVGHYDIETGLPAGVRRGRVFMEINRSYDFNAAWHPDRFPDDPVYSGSGSSGQPSIIYSAEVDLDGDRNAWLLEPIGHGHPSGADGDLTADLTGFDSALALVGPVVVERGP